MFQLRPVSGETRTVYTTADDREFSDSIDANNHQLVLDFKAWYEGFGDELYAGTSHGKVEAEDLVEWLISNKEVVKQVLEVISSHTT